MAQFWIAIFFIFLAVAQLYQSIKDINLPLPVYLVLGAMLAVASNSQQQLSFTPARQITLPTPEELEPILSLIPAHPFADNIKLADSNTLAPLSPRLLPPPVELADEIQPVDSEPAPVISTAPISPEVSQAEIEPVESEIVPIRLTEIPSADNSQLVDTAAPVVSLAATEPSPPEIPVINPVDSDEPLVALVEPLPEVSSKKQLKPVAKKTNRKKATSSKIRK
jgi:hypothetical protein